MRWKLPPAAEGVVDVGVGAVEADSQPLDARLANAGGFAVQRRGRRRRAISRPDAAAVGDQFHQVVPLQRNATFSTTIGRLGNVAICETVACSVGC